MSQKHVIRVRSTLPSSCQDKTSHEAARQRREFIARERAKSNGLSPWRNMRSVKDVANLDLWNGD